MLFFYLLLNLAFLPPSSDSVGAVILTCPTYPTVNLPTSLFLLKRKPTTIVLIIILLNMVISKFLRKIKRPRSQTPTFQDKKTLKRNNFLLKNDICIKYLKFNITTNIYLGKFRYINENMFMNLQPITWVRNFQIRTQSINGSICISDNNRTRIYNFACSKKV